VSPSRSNAPNKEKQLKEYKSIPGQSGERSLRKEDLREGVDAQSSPEHMERDGRGEKTKDEYKNPDASPLVVKNQRGTYLVESMRKELAQSFMAIGAYFGLSTLYIDGIFSELGNHVPREVVAESIKSLAKELSKAHRSKVEKMILPVFQRQLPPWTNVKKRIEDAAGAVAEREDPWRYLKMVFRLACMIEVVRLELKTEIRRGYAHTRTETPLKSMTKAEILMVRTVINEYPDTVTQKRMAKKTKMSERHIRDTAAKLKKKEIIIIEGGRGRRGVAYKWNPKA